MTPVKEYALEKSIEVYQPDRIDETLIQLFRQHMVDLTVVVAYGKILPHSIVRYPKHGSLNLHASLLPKYRGPSPIQAAIFAGASVSGITLQLMTDKMDAGDILASTKIVLEEDWSAADLFAQVALLSPHFLVQSTGQNMLRNCSVWSGHTIYGLLRLPFWMGKYCGFTTQKFHHPSIMAGVRKGRL
jgi:methionyl-tRNA formyltransferase